VLPPAPPKFIQTFAKLGLVPDPAAPVSARLGRQCPRGGMTLLAEPVTAEQAEAWGMIGRRSMIAGLMTEGASYCGAFTVQPTAGLALIRKALDASPTNTLDRSSTSNVISRGSGPPSGFHRGRDGFHRKACARFNRQTVMNSIWESPVLQIPLRKLTQLTPHRASRPVRTGIAR